MATELGQAYVQIMPSAKGISGAIKSQLDPEATSAGISAGSKIGTALKIGAVATVAAAGVALGKIISSSLTEGAELQQSLGGIETLFKGSADKVKEYADNAYKTSGLSANKYMQTVTSFSASLLQSLGGDTEKAADKANMALIDMSDNANKMGTSMESIQDAYRGFAKSNYTMLDNLSLGYGGTKTEMERLLADATKLTGVKYDISNLSDVYDAIHVIQEELGITGTTALESAETFSGSLASMKAAFSNVLGKLSLGQDIKPALESLAETTSTFLFNNFIPMVGNILKGLPGAIFVFIKSAIPHIVEGIKGLLETLGIELGESLDFSGIKTAITTVIEAIGEMVGTLIEILGPTIEKVIGAFTELWNVLQPLISTLSGILIPIFVFLGKYLGTVFKIALEGVAEVFELVKLVIEKVSPVIETAINAIPTAIEGLITAGTNLKNSLTEAWETIKNSISKASESITKIVDGIKKLFEGLKNISLRSAGEAIINGFLGGLKSAYESVKTFVKGIGKWIAKNKGPISYDKKLLIPAGSAIMAGLNKGLKDQFETVKSTVGGMAEELQNIMTASPIDKVVTAGLNQNINYQPNEYNQNSKLEKILKTLENQLDKNIDVILNLDGKEVARATYKYNQEFIDRDTKMKARRKGDIY